jgi:hypothetical protein
LLPHPRHGQRPSPLNLRNDLTASTPPTRRSILLLSTIPGRILSVVSAQSCAALICAPHLHSRGARPGSPQLQVHETFAITNKPRSAERPRRSDFGTHGRRIGGASSITVAIMDPNEDEISQVLDFLDLDRLQDRGLVIQALKVPRPCASQRP